MKTDSLGFLRGGALLGALVLAACGDDGGGQSLQRRDAGPTSDAAGGAVDASTGSACVGCACASSASCSGAGEIGLEPAAFEAFERAWSRALLADACTLAEQELIAESDADAWESFRRHHLDGLEYAEIAQQLRITPAEARTRARRAAYRYERALVQLLRDEGVGEDELDAEIAWLLEVSTR